MVVAHNSYCPKHGMQPFLNDECKQCSIEKERTEQERWNNLTVEEKLDELKQRVDSIEFTPRILGNY